MHCSASEGLKRRRQGSGEDGQWGSGDSPVKAGEEEEGRRMRMKLSLPRV